MNKDFTDKIAAPGCEFRGAPFWAWNAKLEPEELRRQIRLMHEMGMGGFFMHARVGLNTKYLGEEWFECVRACIDEARKLKMNAWLYDEDRWPSGAGGGYVTANPDYRMRALAMKVYDQAPAEAEYEYLALFAAKVGEKGITVPRRLKNLSDPLQDGEKMLAFFVIVSNTSSWYNDQTYLDTMNEDAVRKFIEVTHKAYAREIGGEFGKTVPGIFTDEPNYLHIFTEHKSYVPWTGAIPERFLKAYGYDLLEHLPELFYRVDGEEFSKARLNFRDMLTTLFVNAFSKQIGEWCTENNMQFTGHVLVEDFMSGQLKMVGSAMRFYEYMQTPGIDLLTEHWNVFDTAKQCTSMAHQFGNKWRLTETYGCTGWDFPFFGHKALGDWQFAMGINLRCQHLAWYSMAAEAKRDYPASISYQSPWFREYPVVEDYFARLGAALSEGEEVRDLLVIHPIESAWAISSLEDQNKEQEFAEDKTLIDLRNAILKVNIDFDYGDEEIMSRHGKVTGSAICINKAGYKAVLVPQLRTIRATTLKLLQEFSRNGGLVAYIGNPPAYLGGEKSDRPAKAFATFTPTTADKISDTFSKTARQVSITGKDGAEIEPVLHILRQGNELSTLFICNTSVNMMDRQMDAPLVRDRNLEFPETNVAWKGQATAAIYELDLSSGKIWKIVSEYRDGCHCFKTSFPVLGSRLFFASAADMANSAAPIISQYLGNRTGLSAEWNYKLDDYNVLVLDHAAFSFDGGEFGDTQYIIKTDDAIREKLGVRPRGGAMVQPWLSGEKTPDKKVPVVLEYTFDCQDIPSETCYLGIERPDLYEITLNGQAISTADQGWWCDLSLRKLELPASCFRKGENKMRLTCQYHQYLPGFEAIFILGNFGVCAQAITGLPGKLTFGDWCALGLQNYSGNVVYSQKFHHDGKPLAVKIGEWRGAALGVSVNGSERRIIAWPPYEMDIANLLKAGENTLEITVFGHRRNSHGPFYLNEKWPAWTGPVQFKTYEHPERQLVPCGLLSNPELIG